MLTCGRILNLRRGAGMPFWPPANVEELGVLEPCRRRLGNQPPKHRNMRRYPRTKIDVEHEAFLDCEDDFPRESIGFLRNYVSFASGKQQTWGYFMRIPLGISLALYLVISGLI